MKQLKENNLVALLVIFMFYCFVFLLSFSGSVGAYKNYTVGGDLGWYDSTEKANVDYQKWADGKNFSLGDFLSKFFFLLARNLQNVKASL